jgi:hypothetical protein
VAKTLQRPPGVSTSAISPSVTLKTFAEKLLSPPTAPQSADRCRRCCRVAGALEAVCSILSPCFGVAGRNVQAPTRRPRGVFTSVKDLASKLNRSIRHCNRAPKRIKWAYLDPSNRISMDTISHVRGH